MENSIIKRKNLVELRSNLFINIRTIENNSANEDYYNFTPIINKKPLDFKFNDKIMIKGLILLFRVFSICGKNG